jgi:hypothetical protein
MDDQNIEFTFIMCISSIVEVIKKQSRFTLTGLQEIDGTINQVNTISALEQTLALVEVENSWASGIVISSDGCILLYL